MLRGYGNVNNKLQCMCVPMHAHVCTCIQMLVEVRDVVFPQAVSTFVCVCVCEIKSLAELEAHWVCNAHWPMSSRNLSVYIFFQNWNYKFMTWVSGCNPISSCLLALFHRLNHEYSLNNEVLEKSFKWTIGAVSDSFPEHFQREKTVTVKISESSVKVKNQQEMLKSCPWQWH